MRILHYSKYYPPVFGGLEKVVYDLVEGINSTDIKCDVLCANKHGKTHTEERRGYKVIRSRQLGVIASTSVSPANISHYARIRNHYDIIHIHAPNPLANLALLMFPTKAKIVVHWHSDIIKQKTLLKLYNPLQEWLLQRADAIIATSEPYAVSSPWLSRYKDKVRIIPIGLNTDHLSAEDNDIHEIKEKYLNRKIIFSLGRLTYYKGFEFLIRAAKDIENAVVLIGGEGEDHQKLQKQISDMGISERVVLLGGIPQSQLGSYYNACDIFCLPSCAKTEAFGVVQLEAMSCGKPIVSTNIEGSGVPWVNKNEVSGLIVEPKDSAALANALNQLCNDEGLRLHLGKGARQRYEQEFTLSRMIDKTIQLYKVTCSPVSPCL